MVLQILFIRLLYNWYLLADEQSVLFEFYLLESVRAADLLLQLMEEFCHLNRIL
jgi:hypothetical protein